MAESKHHHVGINQGDTEKPPRAHVERTRDVFRDGKAPVIKQQAQPEAKVQSRRAPPEKQPARKKERQPVAEYDDGEGVEEQEEELSAEEKRAKDLAEHEEQITYSNYYYDDEFEYRHVTLPKEIAQWLPHHGLLAEEEWRSLGVKQSLGWEHYMIHAPEPHVLLFKRVRDYQNKFPPKKHKEQPTADPKASKLHERLPTHTDSQANHKKPRAH